jgi:methionyl-tRNA synthetase
MNISHDEWIRTTDAGHEQLVCSFLQRVKDRGDIYKDTYEGYYCVGCEKYLDDEEMDGGKACKTHKAECSFRREENHFFRLSRYALLP